MDPQSLHRQAKERYWKEKDLPATIKLLEQGIELAKSQGMGSEQKGMNYDLASFCWPGWDEPGIAISEENVRVGEAAAKENLRLAEELKKGDAPMANAWFMIGAYHLANRRFNAADDAFANSMDASYRAGNSDHMLLGAGFRVLANELAEGRSDVAIPCRRIEAEGGEHGAMFAEQLRTAAKVFGP